MRNSFRQVLEGLKCQDPQWSRSFLQNPPAAFGSTALTGFDLTTRDVQIRGDTATLRFTPTVRSGSGSLSRSGQVSLTFVDGRWRVNYADLARLNLPIFPPAGDG
ncbi:MAG TPA: hypothetical protein VFS50_02815 [Meiothermus sp.]|nr:hypothetical protein [Meiothermus sp.]